MGIVHSPDSLHPAVCLCPLSLPVDCSPHEAKLISANCNAGRVAPLTPLLPPQPFSPSDTCGTHQGAPPRCPSPGPPHPSPAAAGLTADTRSCLFWAATYPGGHVPFPSEASHGQCLTWWLGSQETTHPGLRERNSAVYVMLSPAGIRTERDFVGECILLPVLPLLFLLPSFPVGFSRRALPAYFPVSASAPQELSPSLMPSVIRGTLACQPSVLHLILS